MSNKILLILLGVAFISFRLHAQEVNSRIMTLDECLKFAYEHNEDLLNANLEKAKQDAYVGEVMAEGFPQINASADFRKNFRIRSTFVPAIFFDSTAEVGEKRAVQFGTPYDGDIGVNASQMVFNGSYFVGLKAAKTLKELTHKDYLKSRIDVAESVSKAYYSVLVAEEGLRIVKANHQRLDSLLSETKVMYENGFVEKIDLMRTQVQYNNIDAQLKNQQRLVENSKEVLKFQMGMPMDFTVEIADKPSDLNISYAETLNQEINEKRRIEYQQLRIRERLAQLDLKNNHVSYLPQLDLVFGMGMNAGTENIGDLFSIGGEQWFNYQYAGISLSIPIFDGFLKSNKIQQNRIELRQINNQFNRLEKSIHLEVRDAKTSLLNNINNLKNQEENMELAQEVYNVSKIKYEEGIGSSLELIEADNDYKEAQANYYNALLEALLAKIDYEKALGILVE